MTWRRTAEALMLVAGMTAAAACSSSTPTKASDPVPNFQGAYTGTSAVASCVEDGNFTGFCAGVGFTSGATFPMTVNLTQSQSSVSGTIAVLGLNGSLQGTASALSGLTATGTLSDVTDSGVTLSTSIQSWSSTLNGSAMTGSYKLNFRSNALIGSSTVSVNIVQLTR
jgi:hypothetical protein